MEIIAENLGKRFIRSWVFRNFSYTFQAQTAYAITGNNGSGKSTLLKILSGIESPSEGSIQTSKASPIIGFASPYQEIIEEFTLLEHLKFHFEMLHQQVNYDELLDLLALPKAKNKQVQNFSSGMRQRLKLLLAFYTDSDALFLDEPTVNLDSQGIDWYQALIEQKSKDKLLLICSNQPYEYQCCQKIIDITNYHYSK